MESKDYFEKVMQGKHQQKYTCRFVERSYEKSVIYWK